MNEAIVQYVADTSPATGATYWTHLTLAIYADDDAYVRKPQPELARAARLNVGSLRRCVRELITLDLVVVAEQPSGWTPALLRLVGAPHTPAPTAPRARSGARRERGRSAPRARSDEQALLALEELTTQPNPDGLGSPVAPAGADDDAPTGRGVAQRVWAARNPKPAQPFVAVMKIADALIAAGWEPSDIERAMVVVPTISTRSCELELNRDRPRTPSAPIDTERSLPGGRVTL